MTAFSFQRADTRSITRVVAQPVDEETLKVAKDMLASISCRGDQAVLELAARFGELRTDGSCLISRDECDRARVSLSTEDRSVLERAASRIRAFAQAQRSCVRDCNIEIEGGRAGHEWIPVDAAGCYAPGGRYPLPSSVLMTAVTARVAGVRTVVVASPKPTVHTLAAAAIADADFVLALGGVQAIGAMAYGLCGVPRCDMIVGPGNRFVTAAKHIVSAHTGIDMLAGPSELLIIADRSASPSIVAADLIAQAEHDSDAIVTLVTTDAELVKEVERIVSEQLRDLPTAAVARSSLANAKAYVVCDINEAITISDALAPEHLELQVRDANSVASRIRHAGAIFIGSGAAEVLGDYGAGPNHTLPTGSSARYRAGLSVFSFLRARTFIEGDFGASADQLMRDVASLARMESLEGHARAAEVRRS